MENWLIILIIVVVVLGTIYFIFTRSQKEPSWKNEVKSKLNQLSVHTNSTNFHELKSSLIDHDKLVDHALKLQKTKGETMGERLKNSSDLFDRNSYNQIWEAHKLRNRLVHEFELSVGNNDLKRSIANLRRILQESSK